MKEILPPKDGAIKICGPVRVYKGAFRPSLFSLRVPCREGVLLHHTLTGEVLLLSPEEAQRAETDETLRQTLIEKRFLSPTGFDEYAYACQFRNIAALMAPRQREITHFTIFTTTDCNARCPYCYELGRPRRSMSEQVARDAAAYIARVCGEKKVSLSWFGGEPLYNAGTIDVITDALRMAGVPYRSRMVSNGYLFDEDMLRRARASWALDRVQITLDGREQTYNRTKRFIYPEGNAYARVLHNIERLLAADIAVTIRLNASQENMDELLQLADELAERFGDQRKLTVYSVLLRDFASDRPQPETTAETLAAWDRLQHRIMVSGVGGVRRLPRSLKTNNCMADNDSSVTILPDGRLGKCEHESEQLLVGSIYDGVTDPDMVARWKERVEVPACRMCPFLPSCTRLRLCSWTGDRCTKADRERIRLGVEQSVFNEYQRFLAGEGNGGEQRDEAEADFDFSGFGR